MPSASRARPTPTSAKTKNSSDSISEANSFWNSCRRGRWPSGCAPAGAGLERSSRPPAAGRRGPLAERRRAGGSGIGAFYTPTGVGTQVADGGLPWRYKPDGSIALASPKKETRDFDGRTYVLEEGIVCDFALVRASVGDRHGNLVFHKSTRNFNPLCAMAGQITIAEVEELVEPGQIDPEQVHTPGIFVQRVVVVGPHDKRIERLTTRQRGGR